MGAVIGAGLAWLGGLSGASIATGIGATAAVAGTAHSIHKANTADSSPGKTSVGPTGVASQEKEDEISLGAGKNKRARSSSRKQLMAPQTASGDTSSKKVGSGLNV